MNARIFVATLLLALAVPASGQDDAAVRKDLTAVIALQGKPCGEVIRVEKKGEDDFVATCKDGNRYRVFVKPEGRVVVEKM